MVKKQFPKLTTSGIVLYFGVLLAFIAVAIYLKQYSLAIGEGAVTVLLFAYYWMAAARQKKALVAYLQSTTASLETAFKNDVPFPMAIVSITTGELHWSNRQFAQVTGIRTGVLHQHIGEAMNDFSLQWLAEGKPEAPEDFAIGNRRYRVVGNQIHDHAQGDDMFLGTIYLLDVTELLNTRDIYQRTRPVVGVILIDNYEELIYQQTDGAISNLDADLSRCLTQWIEGTGGLLRKLERNRYLFLFDTETFHRIVQEKFSILESIRTVTNGNGLPATISMGVGREGENFLENYNFATMSLEMALSRGGDQAVIKQRLNFNFFGGKTKEADRRTKVKSRVVANSLMELMGQSSYVFIMGHKNADLDSLGAAVGVFAMARKKGRRAYIILDQQVNQVKELLAQFQTVAEYETLFITPDDAMLLADTRSLLVVVDTNRPDQVESRPLLESIPRVAVIDHHRRAADYIEQVVLTLHETSASSAAELVTELLTYAVDPKSIRPLEANALLAGIVLDTKNFNVRTGSGTFEAAAYLRRCGADTVMVKKLFQNDLETTVARQNIIRAARLYRGNIAIAAMDHTVSRVIAAKASDALLDISNIETSFVLYPDGDVVYISARAINDTNVQMILEPLGGGGNAATAGAQVNGSVTDVLRQLVTSIDQYFES